MSHKHILIHNQGTETLYSLRKGLNTSRTEYLYQQNIQYLYIHIIYQHLKNFIIHYKFVINVYIKHVH